ncbi:hypothetical protein EXZ60_17625 [Vibrio sp. 1151_11]|uniref:hypothetical protein n=1 Tax=Vibrio sp. 1151_11 TaxID=2527670 RepID=UPI0024064EC9|nr:hypothetical protein [Vibrio sp. 1151_11]MDF9390600.1 hypothetical protein [Vibrio sp. 1151_11]
MISNVNLKKVLDKSYASYSSDDVLKIHRHVEGYLKRVFLIGLRLNSVQYETARTIVDTAHLDIKSMVAKAWYLLDSSSHRNQSVAISHLSANYPDMIKLRDLFFSFSCVYRNKLAHGIIDTISGQELIDTLCHLNISFYKEMERVFQLEHGHSAYESPGDWGAARGTSEDVLVAMGRLHLGNLSANPKSTAVVISELATTSYPKP